MVGERFDAVASFGSGGLMLELSGVLGDESLVEVAPDALVREVHALLALAGGWYQRAISVDPRRFSR